MVAMLRVLAMNSLAPPYGGAETHFADLVELLRENGAHVEVHTPLPATGFASVRDRVFNAAVHRFTRERIAAFRPDVIHVHNFLRRLSVAPFLAARGTGVATMLTVHDFQLFCPRTWALRADGSPCEEPQLLRCAFGGCLGGLEGVSGRAVYAMNTVRQRAAAALVRRHATRIVAPSAALAQRLTQSLRREVGVLPLRPAPAPVRSFVSPSSRDLLFVGRLSPEKGLRELLAVLGPEQRLTIAGDGPISGELRTIVASRRLDGSVRFIGQVSRDEVTTLLASHGALVLPSVWMENSPLSVLEALAAGRPVIASRRGGIPELVEDGQTGFLFEPRDPASIREALTRFQSMSAEEHDAMSRRALARAELSADRTAGFELVDSEYRAAMAAVRGGSPA